MSSRAEVEVSYDVDNDFFRLWLDGEMNYTCALWDGAGSLEAAQARKLSVLCDMARVTQGQRVLDIGCGWGAALRYLVTARGAAAQASRCRPRSAPRSNAAARAGSPCR